MAAANRSPEAQTMHAGPPSAAPPTGRRRRSLEIGLIFGLWTVVGILFGSTSYIRAKLFGEGVDVLRAATVAGVDVYSWALLSLCALWATRRFPLDHGRRAHHAMLHMVMALVLVSLRGLGLHYIFQATGWYPPRSSLQALISFVPPNLVSYWMLLGAAHAVEYARRFRERELRSSQLETQLTRAQLQMLKMQLHPHFLFNTLHAISSLVHRSPDTAERMIASLSELLRTTLTHQQAQEVTVAEEMDLLEPYLEIEKMRLGDRLEIRAEIPPEVRGALLPHLILQPLVENAIRHGLAPKRAGGTITIGAAREGGWLRIRVEDDGRGFDGAPQRGGPGGVGLTNTRARLEQLYGGDHRFTLTSRAGEGTEVEIEIPYHVSGAPEASPEMSRA